MSASVTLVNSSPALSHACLYTSLRSGMRVPPPRTRRFRTWPSATTNAATWPESPSEWADRLLIAKIFTGSAFSTCLFARLTG